MSLFIIHCIQLDFDIALEVIRLAARIDCEMEGSGGGMDDVSLHIDSYFNQEILYLTYFDLMLAIIRIQCSCSDYTSYKQ